MKILPTIARTALAGLIVLPVFSAEAGILDRLQLREPRSGEKAGAPGYERIVPDNGLPGVFGGTAGSKNRQYAQSSEAVFRVNQMEEQVRQLNGRVEELTFQLLQLQEQIRKMQEDNEYRFQELEDKQGSLGGEKIRLGKQQSSDTQDLAGASDGTRKTIEQVIAGERSRADPPISLGTLTFDTEGNLVDSNIGRPVDLTGEQSALAASLPVEPVELFELGYEYVQGGRYERAVEVYERFSADHPGDARLPEARFWLGESLFSLGRYEEAAQVFLDNHRQHPQAPLAAENLLKLGVSLAGLNQRELACATYAEVPKKYPGISNAVRKRIDVEQRAAKCKAG